MLNSWNKKFIPKISFKCIMIILLWLCSIRRNRIVQWSKRNQFYTLEIVLNIRRKRGCVPSLTIQKDVSIWVRHKNATKMRSIKSCDSMLTRVRMNVRFDWLRSDLWMEFLCFHFLFFVVFCLSVEFFCFVRCSRHSCLVLVWMLNLHTFLINSCNLKNWLILKALNDKQLSTIWNAHIKQSQLNSVHRCLYSHAN